MALVLALACLAAGVALFVVGYRRSCPARRPAAPSCRERPGAWGWFAVLWSTAMSGMFAVLPIVATESVSNGAGAELHHRTMLEAEGAGGALVLGIPIVAAIAFIGTRRAGLRIAIAALLLAGCVLSSATVGLFYAPAAVALAVAAILTRPTAMRRPT